MKRLHKLLVILLSLSMLLGVIAISAFAADDTVAKIGDEEYTSLSAAVAAANGQTAVDENGDPEAVTITLVKDVTLGASEGLTLELDKLALTIDLNGKTLDVSNVGPIRDPGATKDREVKAAIFARGAGSVLTFKNGTVINFGDKNGVFGIEKDRDACIVIEGVTVNAKGGISTPIVNARNGKVTVSDCEFVSYGYNAAVVRQAGNAEIIIEDSELLNIDGTGMQSAVIKTEGTATAVLSDTVDDKIVERPHIYVKNTEMFAASNVIITHLSGEARPATCIKPILLFEDCDIEQCNKLSYNNDETLLLQSNNYVLRGNNAVVEFDGCNVEYARVAIATSDALEVKIDNSVFSMTLLGQQYYMNETTDLKTECDSYFVSGKGKVSVTNTAIYLPKLANGKFVPIADNVALQYADSLDVLSKDGLKLGKGCVTNSTDDFGDLRILAIACTCYPIAEGSYIDIFAPEKDEWSDKWYSDNSYEAKLNGKKYKTFAEAYADAKDGDKIELLSNIAGMQSIEKEISVRNFVGYEFKHTSATYKSITSRGFIDFIPAKAYELISVKLVTDTGTEEMLVAAGNYAVYNGSLAAGWRFSDYRIINFKGWGETPDNANLGADLPYIDGSVSSITVYAVFDEIYDLDADYAVTELNGDFIAFGGSYDELAETNNVFMSGKFNGEGEKARDKVIVLLRDIYTDKTINTNINGNIYIDLNGHKIVTKNNFLFSSDLSNFIYQYDGAKEDGKVPIRRYNKNFTVWERKDANSPWEQVSNTPFYAVKSADDPQMTEYAIGLGDFELAAGRSNGGVTTNFYLFSSRPGASVDTGSSPMLKIISHMRVRMYTEGKGKELINSNTNTNKVNIGNSKLSADMAARVGDNQITFNCKTLGNYNEIFNHANYIDDAIIIASGAGGAITCSDTVGLKGTIFITNSVLMNTTAGACLIQLDSLAALYVEGTTFVATPNGATYPEFMGKLAFHSGMPASTTKREITGCNFINCKPTVKTLTNNGTTVLVKDIAYNVAGGVTVNTEGLVLDASYVVNEDAVWNIPVTVGDEVYYLAYKTLHSSATPETVTVTWCDADGNTIGEETYFRGAKVVYNGALSSGVVDGKPYVNLSKFVIEAIGDADLDSIQADAQVMVSEVVYGIDAEVEVRHNVNISSELTVSIYVPVLSEITKISLMTPDGENLINPENTVILGDGAEYYVVTSVAISPNQIHRNIVYAITVSDGTYTDVVYKSVSILGYAEKLLADKEAKDSVKALVSAMLVYANESYKYFDGAENADVAALIGEYEVSAPTAETAKDVAAISEYVLYASLQLNSRIAFVFEVADGVEALTINGVEYAAVDGFVVYDCDVAATNDLISVEVGGAVGAYDLVAYIAAVAPVADELTAYDLASALYSFAAAADAYLADN